MSIVKKIKEPKEINPRPDYRVFIVDEFGEVLDEIEHTSTIVEGAIKDTLLLSPAVFESVTIKNHFVKLNEVAFSRIENVKLDKVCLLLPYVGYMDGILTYKNNKRVNSDLAISKICGMSKNTSTKFVKSLIEEDIIHKKTSKDSTYYMFNPFICLRGNKARTTLFEEFETSKWRFVNTDEIEKSNVLNQSKNK